MKLTATVDTFLKAFPVQATELKERNLPDQLFFVRAGTTLEIVDHDVHEGRPDTNTDDHYFVQLQKPVEGVQGVRWFIYSLHAQIEGTEPNNNPQDAPVEQPVRSQPEDTGPKITLPGISRPVGILEPVYWGSHFTWAEMTKNGQRIPVDTATTERIVKLCKYMDEVRSYLGDRPIKVTSAYRDPVTNRAVGGASRSRHMAGDAIDFYIDGENVVDTFMKLKSYHTRSGLAVGRGFVHLDLRPGGPVRWLYPSGPNINLW